MGHCSGAWDRQAPAPAPLPVLVYSAGMRLVEGGGRAPSCQARGRTDTPRGRQGTLTPSCSSAAPRPFSIFTSQPHCSTTRWRTNTPRSIPHLSLAPTSAWAAIRSSTRSSTASLAASIRAVVPSTVLASTAVCLFRSRSWGAREGRPPRVCPGLQLRPSQHPPPNPHAATSGPHAHITVLFAKPCRRLLPGFPSTLCALTWHTSRASAATAV